MLESKEIITRIVTPPPPTAPGFHLVVGPREMQSLVLFSLAWRLSAGLKVYWIDAGNWFDAYGLGKAARVAQLDERKILSHIQVARPFTAIQLTSMLAKKIPLLPLSCPIIVSDPMALFYDHEMPEDEVNRIFRNFIDVVRGLPCPVLALAVQREVPASRKHLSKQLLIEVNDVAHFHAAPRLE